MNNLGTFVALAEGGRLFGLDLQLLLDAAITAVNVFILFILLSYILYNPVRTMLKKRQDKITSDRGNINENRLVSNRKFSCTRIWLYDWTGISSGAGAWL